MVNTATNKNAIDALAAGDAFFVDDASDLDPTTSRPITKKGTPAQMATYVIASDTNINALSGVTAAANKIPYFTSTSSAAVATLSTFSRTLIGSTSAAAYRTSLGIPGSTTDHALLRSNGTTGQTQGSGVTLSDSDELYGFYGRVVAKNSTNITLGASDCGTIITTTSTKAAATINLPNSLSTGFNCSVIQNSTTAITFAASTGATLNNRQSHTKIAGQHGVASLVVTGQSTANTAAVYILGGDTAS